MHEKILIMKGLCTFFLPTHIGDNHNRWGGLKRQMAYYYVLGPNSGILKCQGMWLRPNMVDFLISYFSNLFTIK